MRKMIFCCFAALSLLAACDTIEDNGIEVSDEIISSFQDMFPGARGAYWEKRGVYRVVTFSYGDDRLTAWYNQDGGWCMSEKSTDSYSAPLQVMTAHGLQKERKGGTDVVSVDQLSREMAEDVYVVVQGEGDARVEYFYSGDGILVKVIDKETRGYEDYRLEIVPQIPGQVYDNVAYLQPGARIMGVDVIFPGTLLIDIIDGMTVKTMEFGLTGTWGKTVWQLTEEYVRTQLPDVYQAGFEQQGYSDLCSITAIECWQSHAGVDYWFYIDKNGSEGKVKVSQDGTVTVVS